MKKKIESLGMLKLSQEGFREHIFAVSDVKVQI